ncbi:MAG: hypothetical protein KC503_05535 [Myxococcales bacterium]|nr:hypothetical protein [Myxococcales bacterium]
MDTSKFDFDKLAAEYGTPFYLYDMDQAVAHYNAITKHLPSQVGVYYCIKANNNPRVMSIFKDHVPGIDISSIGELDLATAVGYTPQQMSFAGPGKSDNELRRAVENDIHLLSIESHNELTRLIAICKEMGKRINVTIRINPLSIPNAFNMKMGGRPSQFGVPEEDVDPTVELAKNAAEIELKGIHVFSGTQCLDQPSIIENLKQTLSISARIAREHDIKPEIINLGGGFGVPYFPGQEAMDVDSLSKEAGATIEAFVADEPRCKDTQFFFELGRYMIGFFGVYVTRVLDIKETRGKRFVIMDGGMNHCFAATGNFGQLVKKNYPVLNLSHSDAAASKCEVVGPLCTPLDSMARNIEMPAAEIGDLICFNNCGAYSYSASPLLFLGHDTPPEVVHYKGERQIARPRRPGTFFT